MRTLYQEQLAGLNFSPVSVLTPKQKTWLNYESFGQFDNSDILIRKYGIKDEEQIVLLQTNGREKKLFFFRAFGNIQVRGDWATASYFHTDKRYTSEHYVDIVIYNNKTKKLKKLTKGKKYLDPAMHPNKNEIAAVEYHNGDYDIVLIDAKTGEKLRNLKLKNNQIFAPSWSDDGRFLTYSKGQINPFKGTALCIYDLKENREEIILDYNFIHNASDPVFYNNYIFFISSYSGIDNCYALEIDTKKIYQVTSRPFGIYKPRISTDGEFLILNDYGDIHGFDVVRMPIHPPDWIPLSKVERRNIDVTKGIDTEDEINKATSVWRQEASTTSFISKKYSPSKNAINIHSWGFLVEPTALQNLDFGRIRVHLSGDDILGTTSFQLKIGYRFFYPSEIQSYLDRQLNAFVSPNNLWDGEFSLSIKKYFPIFTWRTLYHPIQVFNYRYDWQNDFSITLPITDSTPHGHQSFFSTLAARVIYRRNELLTLPQAMFVYGNQKGDWFWQTSITYSLVLPEVSYRRFYENSLVANFNIQTPGIFELDKTFGSITYERFSSVDALITALPRGIVFSLIPFPNENLAFRYDYRWSLLYPNFGIPALVFFKRVWFETSLDYNLLKYTSWHGAGSTGISVFVEGSWFNYSIVNLHLGISLFYLFQKPAEYLSGNWAIFPEIRLLF